MKNAIIVLLTVLAVSCSSSKHSTATVPPGGDAEAGTSFANAVVIRESSETKGVNAEYKWIREHYPGSQVKRQSLTQNGKKPYDILTIVTAEGKELPVYFDISHYFGKW